MSKDKEEYDYESILHSQKAPTSIAQGIDDQLRIDPGDSIQTRWEKHQALGKKQKEAGVEVPAVKHRCDDHLEDIVRAPNLFLFYSVIHCGT